MVERKEYLAELVGWKDEQVIKVVTGIRRCGKSTLLAQYQDWLRVNGVTDAQIVSVNFEELEYEELLDYKKLYAYLKERLVAGRTTYIFLDEIQKVADFEKVVDSLYVKPDVDIYITGSNAYMLSGDLATLLTGRYVEVKMLPLSLKEFLKITELDADRGFAEYLQCGGLPYVAKMERTTEKVETYLEGIYNTVIVKDIEDRQARKESEPSKRKVTDIALLKSIAKIGVIGYIAFSEVKKYASDLYLLYDIGLYQAIGLVGDILFSVGIKVAAAYVVIALLDFAYQKWKFRQDMMMTKQEVKDEYKNQEGDPQIKGKQRQRMREASQRRMMQQLPEADVVITNPTHFAVAIKYDPDKYDAPYVLAKGEDYLAQKIKEIAREHDVEIVENKPLARMLYANVDIGGLVPPELYQAVAEVLAFVYHLKGKV